MDRLCSLAACLHGFRYHSFNLFDEVWRLRINIGIPTRPPICFIDVLPRWRLRLQSAGVVLESDRANSGTREFLRGTELLQGSEPTIRSVIILPPQTTYG